MKKIDKIEKNNNIPKNVSHELMDVVEKLKAIWKWKYLIIALFLISTIVTVVVSINMDSIYRSQTTIMPISSRANPLGNIVVLEGLDRVARSDGHPRKIISILRSRTLKERVIKNLNLISAFYKGKPIKTEQLNRAVERLGRMVNISHSRTTGTIEISVDYKQPRIAKDIVNQYVVELQDIMEEKSFTVAKMNRIFIEKRLAEEKERFKKIQSDMMKFQIKNEIFAPEDLQSRMIDLYPRLVEQKIALEVELESLESALSPNNSRILTLKNQIRNMNAEITKMCGILPSLRNKPEKIIEYSDLQMNLKTSQTVYETLTRLYQQAKIEELKDNLFVEVIDEAVISDIPVKPNKRLIVMISALVFISLGVFLALFLEWVGNVTGWGIIHYIEMMDERISRFILKR